MRVSVFMVLASAACAMIAGTGCDSILGIDPHQLAPLDAGPGVDGNTPGTQPDAATTDAGDSGAARDGSPFEAGESGATRDGSPVDGGDDGGGDAASEAEAGGGGGAVAPTSGGIYSGGRVPDDAGVGHLPDGGTMTLTDDGFEFGETLCNGTTCVTGAITP